MAGNATALVRASAPDVLSKAIQYSLAETASYIKERRGALFTPLGGATYNPEQGTRLLRFTISDSHCFLDPSSIVLSFRLRNTGAGPLRLRGPPGTIFERGRILIRGVQCEDVTEIPYVINFLKLTDTKERMTNESILNYWDEDGADVHDPDAGIPPGEGRRVMCDLRFFGLFRNNDKHIPLPWCAITIELTLTDGVNAFYADSEDLAQIPVAPGQPGAPAQAPVNRSQAYTIEDVGLRCDLLLMAPELVGRYSDLLQQGNNFPLAFTSLAVTRHQVFDTEDQDFQTTRSLAMCKSVFFSFSFADAELCEIFAAGPDVETPGPINPRKRRPDLAPWNLMVNPRWRVAADGTDTHDNFQWGLHVGGRRWPVNDVRGTGSESWYQLRATLDLATYGYNSFTQQGWKLDRWMGAVDLEKGAGTLDNLSFTGHPLKSGEPVTIRVKGLARGANMHPTLCFITLAYDAILTINMAGVDINY